MHGSAEVIENLFGAAAAGLVLVGIARLPMEDLALVQRHTAAADPVFAGAEVDVVKVPQVFRPLYIKCGRSGCRSVPETANL